jgi:hypothetical protein
MGMGAKLSLLGAVAAAGLAALGAAGAAYNYFFDPEQGPQRRKTTLNVANSMLEKTGMAGIEKNLMQTFMEKMAVAGK